jgi:hypothetical protein
MICQRSSHIKPLHLHPGVCAHRKVPPQVSSPAVSTCSRDGIRRRCTVSAAWVQTCSRSSVSAFAEASVSWSTVTAVEQHQRSRLRNAGRCAANIVTACGLMQGTCSTSKRCRWDNPWSPAQCNMCGKCKWQSTATHCAACWNRVVRQRGYCCLTVLCTNACLQQQKVDMLMRPAAEGS